MMGVLIGRKKRTVPASRGGFSLIATLTMMMLLTLIGIGLLQLSVVTLRAGSHEKDQAQARANARVALMLALGQLQKEMGPDRRISAPAALQDTKLATVEVEGVENPHFIGIWDAGDEVSISNMDAKPQTGKQGFRTWLVSGDDVRRYDFAAGTALRKDPQARIAVGSGMVDDGADQVFVPVIDTSKGGMAWWTSDNGQKATVRASGEDTDPAPKDLATTLASSRRFNPAGYHAVDPALPGGQEELRKLPGIATLDVAGTPGDKPYRRYFHDLTVRSELVPVDVTAGRLRRCMNLYMAWLGDQSVSARAGAGTLGPKSDAGHDYRMFSWDQLRHALSFAQDPSKVTLDSNGRPQVKAYMQTNYGGGREDTELNPSIAQDRWRIQPVLLKTIHIISYGTEKTAILPDPARPERTHVLRLYDYPVVVLWNPYNVDLVVPEYGAGSSPLPVVFNITSGTEVNQVDWVQRRVAMYMPFGPECPQEKLVNLVIPAGCTRVLFPQKFDTANTTYHRHGRFPYDFYLWMKQKEFDCGPGNYGGPFKNLKGGNADISFSSVPGSEIAGAPGDPIRISVTPSMTNAVGGAWPLTYQWSGEHTDWHGNNGSGTDDLNTLLRFGVSTNAGFRFGTGSPQISVIRDTDVPVRSFEEVEGRPTPLMIFETYRKPVDEDLFPNKNWSFSLPASPIHSGPGTGATDLVTPWHESAYTFRFKAVNSWVEVAQRTQLPPDRDNSIYMGSSYSPSGQLHALGQEVPLVAPVSLAQLQHFPLFDYRPDAPNENPFSQGIDFNFHRGRNTQFAQNNAIGNSYASPGIPATGITGAGWSTFGCDVNNPAPVRLDRSYVANKLLWDAWWCSSVASQTGPFFIRHGSPRTIHEVAEQFLSGQRTLPQEACQFQAAQDAESVMASLFDGGKVKADAYKRFAAFVRINGGFNVNSASPKAWQQLFSQMLSRPTVEMDSVAGDEKPAMIDGAGDKFLVSRFTFQGGGPAERSQGQEREDRWWDGCRELSADDLRKLSEATVREVKKRGPFKSLADFINRSLVADSSLALKGALQAALDDPQTGINGELGGQLVDPPQASGRPAYAFEEAAAGSVRQGIPGWVTQADLLQVIGPVLSPRSDTFTVRAMGETRDPEGKVIARAWCEAVVQRRAEYVSPMDAPEVAAADLQDNINKIFGRRMDLVSFRWLTAPEVN